MENRNWRMGIDKWKIRFGECEIHAQEWAVGNLKRELQQMVFPMVSTISQTFFQPYCALDLCRSVR